MDRPETRDIRDVVAHLAEVAPILLLIDEFGKNLEAFADSHSDADLFLLQELAEWTRGDGGIPLALVTLQHMAFDEYADSATVVQRREWAKIQGRFEDVPFVDSPVQTRALISAAFEPADESIMEAVEDWAAGQARILAKIGLNELAAPSLLARCWPIHPVALAVLPELCERYGQNERTLFSFLASQEPNSVASFLRDTDWDGDPLPPVVRLDRIYDYFIESASSMVGVSSAASRWVEVDTRIRDAHGLDDAARRVLKTIGLLNLVSAGGTLRASKAVILFVCSDGRDDTADADQVTARLGQLERAGLITFRDFADEYRVWQGSDFDLKEATDLARRRLRDEPPAAILEQVLPLRPLVAARHSHNKGTLRAFARRWIEPGADVVEPLGPGDREDGSALYVLGHAAPTGAVLRRDDAKPVAFVTTADPSALIDAAQEVAAIDEVLRTAEDLAEDKVARRELVERRVEARVLLDREFEAAYGTTSAIREQWTYLRPGGTRSSATIVDALTASQALSEVADAWYDKAPVIRNDLVNRHDLSSQAAKARRMLLEAMLAASEREALGIDGHGPDNTMYRSVLRDLGLHRHRGTGWTFTAPGFRSSLRPAWGHLIDILTSATSKRLRVSDIYDRLAAPPFGIRAGVSPIILVVALIIHAEELALYEHGTFRPTLTADLIERFLRNPANFEVKHFATRSGTRAELLTRLADRLEIDPSRGPRNGRVGSALAVVSHLVALVNAVPQHIKRTKHFDPDTQAIRRDLLTATEPDELLFSAIPRALGKPPVPARGEYDNSDLDDIAVRVAVAAGDLRTAYIRLLADLRTSICDELRAPNDRFRENLAERARDIQGKVVDPRVSRLVVALTADIPGDDEWTEYVGLNITGTAPASWTDDDRSRFFALLHDIGGTFRRIEALNADLRARGDDYEAVRIAMTRLDGAESAKVVSVDEHRRGPVGEILADALARVRLLASSDAEARDLLHAVLASQDLGATMPAIGSPVTPAAYSLPDDNEEAAQA